MGKANGVGVGGAVDADVSAVGALVWVRRPNGSWWPGRVASRLELPDGCPAPPRSPATPILLLGRRDGSAFVEWCNLERSKRVKPFRCGEADLDDLIRRTEEQAARRRRAAAASSARNARKEDAVLQALDIERARLRLRPRPPTPSCPPPPPPPRKRKTPNDSEDDAPAARRMRDLTDIGSPQKPTTGQMTRSRQAHHDAAPAKRSKLPPAADQVDNNLPCGALRKKDRSRPLSELCNGVKPSNGLDTSLDKFKPEQAKGVNGTSCVPRPLDDAFAHGPGDQPVDAPIAATAAAASILKPDHLHAQQPCAPTKAPPTLECTKRAPNCSKNGMSSQCDSRNPKKKTTSSADHEGGGRARKGRTAKHKAAPINEVILLKRRTAKSAAAPDEDDKSLVVMLPDALVHAALWPRSEIKCEPEEPSGTIGRHHSNGKTGSLPPVVSEPAPPRRRDLRCHVAVKRTKTLQLNPSLYDVEISSGPGCGGGSKGRHVPLVSLMSRSTRRPVVGYPVSVEVLDAACCHPPAPSVDVVQDAACRHPPAPSVDGVRDAVRCHPPAPSFNGVPDAARRQPPAPSVDGVPGVARRHPPVPSVNRVRDAARRRPPTPGVGGDHPPSTSSGANGLVKVKEEVEEEAPQRAVPASAQRARARRSRRKASEDELWRPHSKEEGVGAAPRPARARRSVRRKAVLEDESWRPHSKKTPASTVTSPRKMRRLSSLGAPGQRGGGEEERRRRKVAGAGAGQLVVACVPVRVVFSRIKEALVSQPHQLKLKSK